MRIFARSLFLALGATALLFLPACTGEPGDDLAEPAAFDEDSEVDELAPQSDDGDDVPDSGATSGSTTTTDDDILCNTPECRKLGGS